MAFCTSLLPWRRDHVNVRLGQTLFMRPAAHLEIYRAEMDFQELFIEFFFSPPLFYTFTSHCIVYLTLEIRADGQRYTAGAEVTLIFYSYYLFLWQT